MTVLSQAHVKLWKKVERAHNTRKSKNDAYMFYSVIVISCSVKQSYSNSLFQFNITLSRLPAVWVK